MIYVRFAVYGWVINKQTMKKLTKNREKIECRGKQKEKSKNDEIGRIH